MGYVSLYLRTQKNIFVLFPSASQHKYFDSSLTQFTPKICWFRFPQLVGLNVYSLRFPQPHMTQKPYGFVLLADNLMPQNILILPSASLHRKYLGFVSLGLVDQ